MRRNNLSALLVFSVVFLLVITCVIPSASLMNAEESDLVLDDPNPSYVEGTEHKVEGIIPIGATAVVNGQNAEVFRKFKHTVKLKDDPSFTSVKIDLIDPNGETAESREVFIENKGILRMWMQQNNPKWTVDGTEHTFYAPPTSFRGSTMLPFRAIAEAFGATVEWVAPTKSIVMKLNDTKLILTIGSNIAKINGVDVELMTATTIINGSVMVPLWFVTEAFGAEVEWHAEDRSVTVEKIIRPQPDDNQTPSLNIGNIFLDDPNPSVLEQTEFTIEGAIPFEHTVKINGEDTEIFRKFKQTIDIKEAPSFTPVNIEVSDSGGTIIEEGKFKVENIYVLRMWLQQNNSNWKVIGTEHNLSVPPTNISGSLLLPFRAIADAFGAEITWIAETKTVILDFGSTHIELTIGNTTAIMNGVEITLTVAPTIKNGSTLVPLRFVGEAFGAEVTWHGEDRSVDIKKLIYP
jgi:Copper amine oxidase N-terminal domain